MSGLLLKLVALVVVLWVLAVNWEVRENVRRIVANGSLNTLHQLFHRQRKTIRGVAMVVLSCVPMLAFRGHAGGMALAFVATFTYLVAYFVRTFNPRLNARRNLPYINRFYVSADPDAAVWPDKWIYARALCEAEQIASLGYDAESIPHLAAQLASAKLQRQLNLILFVGIALSFALYVAATVLASPVVGH